MNDLMKEILVLFKPITNVINAVLDTKLKRQLACAAIITVDLLLAYVIAMIDVGMWLDDSSISGMIAYYILAEKKFPFGVFLLLSVIILLLVYFFMWKSLQGDNERDFTFSENTTYGSARDITRDDLEKIGQIGPADQLSGTIIGQLDLTGNNVVALNTEKKGNRNMLAFGMPGAGKTFAFVNPFLMQCLLRRESVIVTDSKGDIRAGTLDAFRNAGYEVRVLNLKDPDHSDGWDLLSELKLDDIRAEIFAQTFINNTGKGAKDDLASFQVGVLKACCLYVERCKSYTDKTKTFASVYQLVLKGYDYLQQTFAPLENHPTLKCCYEAFSVCQDASPNLRGNIFSGLRTRMSLMSIPAIKKLTSTKDIDLTLPGKKPCIYYVVISDQHGTMKVLSSLFFSFAVQNLVDFADRQKGGVLPVTVNLFMEEFISCVGHLPDMDKYLATCRSRSIPIIMIVQGIGQLIDTYGQSMTDTFINCCSTIFTLGTNDEPTNEFFSWLSGEATIKVKTEQHERYENAITRFLGLHHSTGDGRRNLYTPHELRTLANRKAFVCFSRYNCGMFHTFGINNHVEWKKGRMEEISREPKVSLSDKYAREYLRKAEASRIDDYNTWMQYGGDPRMDYCFPTPEDTSGPCYGSPPPAIIPYDKLEKFALLYAEQKRKDKSLEYETFNPSDYELALENEDLDNSAESAELAEPEDTAGEVFNGEAVYDSAEDESGYDDGEDVEDFVAVEEPDLENDPDLQQEAETRKQSATDILQQMQQKAAEKEAAQHSAEAQSQQSLKKNTSLQPPVTEPKKENSSLSTEEEEDAYEAAPPKLPQGKPGKNTAQNKVEEMLDKQFAAYQSASGNRSFEQERTGNATNAKNRMTTAQSWTVPSGGARQSKTKNQGHYKDKNVKDMIPAKKFK